MLFAKFLPREGNFFELFNQHAERTVEAARAFGNLVKHYGDPHLREKFTQDVDNAERAADRITHEVLKALRCVNIVVERLGRLTYIALQLGQSVHELRCKRLDSVG